MASWLSLPYAGNSLTTTAWDSRIVNRFVLSPAAIEKLGSIHVHEAIKRRSLSTETDSRSMRGDGESRNAGVP